MRPVQKFPDLSLRQPNLFTSGYKPFQKFIVGGLIGCYSPFARNAGLRLLPFPHLPSVVNKVLNPLIGDTPAGV